jgi:hypothetical protein
MEKGDPGLAVSHPLVDVQADGFSSAFYRFYLHKEFHDMNRFLDGVRL